MSEFQEEHEAKGRRICGVCLHREIHFECDGCKIALCNQCITYGLYGTGCGCIQPLYLCPTCHDDPGINPG